MFAFEFAKDVFFGALRQVLGDFAFGPPQDEGAHAGGQPGAGEGIAALAALEVLPLQRTLGGHEDSQGHGGPAWSMRTAVGVLLVTAAVFGYALGTATTCTYTAATQALPAAWRGVAFGYLTSAYLDENTVTIWFRLTPSVARAMASSSAFASAAAICSGV